MPREHGVQGSHWSLEIEYEASSCISMILYFDIPQIFANRQNQFPRAYGVYRRFCRRHLRRNRFHNIPDLSFGANRTLSVQYPLGSALIIPPLEVNQLPCSRSHWIVCLFTSFRPGIRSDIPSSILSYTAAALRDMRDQLPPEAGPLYSCCFNAGLFHVPWERTRALVLEQGLHLTVHIPSPPPNGPHDPAPTTRRYQLQV